MSEQTYDLWRIDYNHYRPNWVLDWRALAAFVADDVLSGIATFNRPEHNPVI